MWATLPTLFRTSRTEFDESLRTRNIEFSSKLASQLKQIDGNLKYSAKLKGDWHSTGCTAIFSDINNAGKFALKQRDGRLELFLGEIANEMSCSIGAKLHAPRIALYDGFCLQDFVETIRHPHIDSYSIGALLGFSLIFGVFDLHDENIIESKHGLSLIDLECGLLIEKGVRHDKFLRSNGLIYDDQSRVRSSFLFSRIDSIDESEVIDGWNAALDHIVDKRSKISYEGIDSFKCRRVLAGTQYYTKLLQRRYAYCETEEELKNNLLRLASFRRVVTAEILEAELGQLVEWNIPYFYQMQGCLYSTNSPKPISRGFSIVHSLRRRLSGIASAGYARRTGILVESLQKFRLAKNLTMRSSGTPQAASA